MSISKQHLNQLILEEYTSMILNEQGRGEKYPYAKPNISLKNQQAIDNTAVLQQKRDAKTGAFYTTGTTNAQPYNVNDLSGPGTYRGWDTIVNSMVTNLSDDFKETKFYRTLKLIQRDIEADLNSIQDPDSEKQQKLRHDIQRLEKWTTGLINCWSEWDCFINGAEYGIRPKMYSPEGIGISAFTSIFPPTVVATRAAFGILLADDIYRFDQGERSAILITDFMFDILGVMAGGLGSSFAKTVSKDVVNVFKNVIFPITEAGFKGATGAELRVALEWAKTSGKKSVQAFLKFIQPYQSNISSFGSTIIQMIDDVGRYLGDWLSGLYEIPVIGNIAYEINRTVLAKLYDAKALLREFVASFTLAIKGLWNLINLPGTTVDAILTKLGVRLPGSTKLAITIGTNAYAISKGIQYYETWNQSKLNDEAIAANNAKIAKVEQEISAEVGSLISKDKQGVFTGADDYIQFYEVKNPAESSLSDRKSVIGTINFEEHPNVIGAPCTIMKFSSDKKYAMIILYNPDPNEDVIVAWTNAEDVKYQYWKN
jgi:hypothetical protein